MFSHNQEIKIFSANSNRPLAQAICDKLGIPMGDSEVKTFADGEVSVSINETVRGCDVFVIQSTCKPVNDSLMELLILIDALRRASAARITAVMPYYGYARQSLRPEGGHEPGHRGQAPPEGQLLRGHEHHRRREGQGLHPL
jgi:ribose-phosphate pyrophosphokinase